MRTRSILFAALGAVTALVVAGYGFGIWPGDRDYTGQAVLSSDAWESPPAKVDSEGRRFDEPDAGRLSPEDSFEVLCVLHAGGSDYYHTRIVTPDGWNDRTWEGWVDADDIKVKPVGSDEAYGSAGAVPDDLDECDEGAPETVTETDPPNVHHRAYVVHYQESLYFSVPDTTFNGRGAGDYDHVTVPDRAEIDVHCVRTTKNIVEEPPSTSYNEDVPYYLATYDGHTGYIDPLWVYFADDPAEVPEALNYDSHTGTVSDHGAVPDLEECPA